MTPFSWNVVATAPPAGVPPNSPAAASMFKDGGGAFGATATGRAGGSNHCMPQ
ncbi:MAG: hypothetical protein JF619_00080 [Massilia sp.]|nr:hypothetical protein [Massilia sp.]